jgi:hypothetical protein
MKKILNCNKILNLNKYNTNCTINNLNNSKKAIIFNESKTAKVTSTKCCSSVVDTIKKRNTRELSFNQDDDDDE